MTRLKHMVGKRFGRLLVLEFCGYTSYGSATFICKCDCGKFKEIIGSCVNRGKIKSCGCISVEKMLQRNKKHGESSTKLYKVWSHMIQRCTLVNDKNYPNYGGRGIFVCKEWAESYLTFKYDVGDGYMQGLQLDRINNDDGYYKENVRWVTCKKNSNNKRTNCYVTHNGETKTAMEWAEVYGLNSRCISNRAKAGFSGEEAIFGVFYLRRMKKSQQNG